MRRLPYLRYLVVLSNQVRTLIDKDSTVDLNAGDDHSKPETKQSRPGEREREASAEPVQWSLQPQLVRAKCAQLTETWGKSFSHSLFEGKGDVR